MEAINQKHLLSSQEINAADVLHQIKNISCFIQDICVGLIDSPLTERGALGFHAVIELQKEQMQKLEDLIVCRNL